MQPLRSWPRHYRIGKPIRIEKPGHALFDGRRDHFFADFRVATCGRHHLNYPEIAWKEPSRRRSSENPRFQIRQSPEQAGQVGNPLQNGFRLVVRAGSFWPPRRPRRSSRPGPFSSARSSFEGARRREVRSGDAGWSNSDRATRRRSLIYVEDWRRKRAGCVWPPARYRPMRRVGRHPGRQPV